MGRRDRRPEDHGRERGEAAWPEIVSRYDEYSLYEFLKSRGFSEGAIEFYAVMNFVESDLHNSFVEVLREELGGAYVDMQTIAGGMDAAQRFLRRARMSSASAPRCGPSSRILPESPCAVVSVQTRCRSPATTRSAPCRSRCPADRASLLTREGAGDPPSSTTTPQPRSFSRCATASGSRTASSAGCLGNRPPDSTPELSARRSHHSTRRPAGFVHVGPGRSAVGRDGRGNAHRGGAR